MKAYPSKIISGWGSGTGMAGVFGSLIVIIIRSFNLSLPYVYFNIF